MPEASTAAPLQPRGRPRAGRVALAIYVLAVLVYGAFANQRLRTHSPDNHFAYLADAFLHRTLAVRCDPAVTRGQVCPPGHGGNDWARYDGRWYVAFPSFPAVLYVPAVAVLGRDFPNRALDVLLAGVAPALLYLLLEKLSRRGHSERSWRENLAFTALFAFGTVYFFTAVQGSVWFTAHVVGCALAVGYLHLGLDAAHPFLSGVLLGLAFHTRTSMIFGALWFGAEALRVHRRAELPGASAVLDEAPWHRRAWGYLRGTDLPPALRSIALFALPVALSIGLYMLLNKLRFGSFTEPGYRYLQIRWQDRIQRWGLFNYHYLSRNLAVVLTLLPWASRSAPYVQVSRHGLALWFTTPHYLELARPRRVPAVAWPLALGAAAIATCDLLYQNSGWVQFGYRFSNDFAIFLVALGALLGRRVGVRWLLLLGFAVAVNAFGAATFDRAGNVYEGDNTAQGLFQPD